MSQWFPPLVAWDEVFWLFSIITLFLAIAQFGSPFITLDTASILMFGKHPNPKPRVRAMIKRLPRFIGVVAILSYGMFFIMTAYFIIRSAYSVAWYIKLNWFPDLEWTIPVLSVLSIFIAAAFIWWFFRRAWKIAGQTDMPSSNEDKLAHSIGKLNTVLQKLESKLDKLDRIDNPVRKLGENGKKGKHSKRR